MNVQCGSGQPRQGWETSEQKICRFGSSLHDSVSTERGGAGPSPDEGDMITRARVPQRHKRAEHLTGARDVPYRHMYIYAHTRSRTHSHTRTHSHPPSSVTPRMFSVGWGEVRATKAAWGGVGWDIRKRGECVLLSDVRAEDLRQSRAAGSAPHFSQSATELFAVT